MTANNFNGYSAREYFWGFKFSEKEPTVTWSFEEEDEDEDYLSHTLYLKLASLGLDAPEKETHILQVETQDYDGNEKKIAIAHLNSATTPMTNLDLSFDHKSIVVFRLVSGKGPVDLAATHLVEFPEEEPGDLTEEDESGDDEEETVEDKNGKALKRKASAALNGKKAKKGKIEDEEDEDEEESEEDPEEDDEDMDDEESEELESSPEVKRGKGKKTAVKKPAQKAGADTKKAKAKPKKGKAK